MQSRGSSRPANMIYSTTPRSQLPYSRFPSQVSVSESSFIGYCDDQLGTDQNYDKCLPPPASRGLQDTLFAGSAGSLNKHPFGKPPNYMPMVTHRNNHISTKGLGWNPQPTNVVPMSTSTSPSGSQSTFTPSSTHSLEPCGATGNRSRQQVGRRSQGSATPRRPTPEEFRSMILCPHDPEHQAHIGDYVGTDSKYTLAKNYAGIVVRLSAKSHDMASKMREVAQILEAIDIFLGVLLEYQGLKPEQKGCVSLRICFGALTALMGDFSRADYVEPSASDPNAPVVPKEYLPQFRSFNPNLRDILRRLATKLEKSMNLYRHRRSPSSSLVAKFQEMSDTLDVWNTHLMDDTFAVPSQIAFDWLKNHPAQVDNRRRNQAYNEQASPNLSDTNRPSPTQADSNYLSPMSAYGDPSRSPNRGSMRPPVAEGYDSLFRSNVTFFPSSNMATGSMSFNNSYRGGSSLDESLGLPSLESGINMFPHQNLSSNAGPYHGTGSGYPPY